MAERDTLKQTLPPDVHDDIDNAYGESEDPDPRDIVAELYRKGLIDPDQVKDAVIALESTLRIRRVAARPPDESAPEVLGKLGAGAMGEVLIAKDPGLNRVVAVKRILPEAARNKSAMRRFYTEAQVTAQLDHPSIVPIHGMVADPDGGLAYAMKLVRGRTLQDYLDEAAASDDPEHNLTARLERFLHVCDAMAYAHERGIVHRDLKPENIMVGAFGEVLVMDWGIAKILSLRDDPVATDEPSTTHKGTRIGQVMGTPRYMSPEQAEGRNDVLDARSDQYALGLILQEVVTLEPAIPPELELGALLGWAQQARHVPMSGAPRELAAIVDKACAADPDRRYASVSGLAEDIRRFLRDEAPLAAPDGGLQRMQRWIGKHRRTALTLIVGLIATIGVAGSGLLAAGVTALGVQQYRAQQRERLLVGAQHRTMDRATAINERLQRIEAGTTGVAYAADAAIRAAAVRPPYKVMLEAPPDRIKSSKYGQSISAQWASIAAPRGRGIDARALEELAGLGNTMTQVMVSTVRGDARGMSKSERTRRIAEVELPVLWTRVGTASGAVAVAPGTVTFDHDPPPVQREPWFAITSTNRGPGWTGPRSDATGLGQVVTCSVPWYADDGEIGGVAAMDVPLSWLSEQLAPPPGATGAWLVDREGNAIAWSGMDTKAKPNPKPLPHPEHAARIDPTRAGFSEGRDRTMAVWSPLATTGWTYVVIGPPSVLTRGVDDG